MTDDKKGRVLVTLQLSIISALLLTTKWQFFNIGSLALYLCSFSIVVRSLIVMPPGSFNIRPVLKKDAKLITNGPYRYIRHPMYVGVLLACGGLVATSYDSLRISLLLSLCFVLYSKACIEERILLAAFPEYQTLKNKTGMITPWI
jgi:protein-S-isoprenylcysteine O-methyltransferase Ste14